MILFLTPGDPGGIGPEITLKALRSPQIRQWQKRGVRIVCVGAAEPFEKARPRLLDPVHPFDLPQARPAELLLIPAPERAPRGLLLPGYQAGWSIDYATRATLAAPESRAIVTGPISKERMQRAGFGFPGHTEFLANRCRVRGEVTMMLANRHLRVSLVTIHAALESVPTLVTQARVLRAIRQTAHALQTWWKIPKPRIAVAGLNPHAGENGMFGKEELRIIGPALQKARRQLGQQGEILGPIPADTLFARHMLAKPKERFDAVVCMYHDQGLIPVKLLDFGGTVNVTLGLPIVRTSVDHGVAFDIAGRGIADPSSLISAIDCAAGILSRPPGRAS